MKVDTSTILRRCILSGIALALCFPGTGLAYLVEGDPRTTMFGSSIWRPKPDWDYDGKRILGHVGFDIYMWDAQTGGVLQKFVGHQDRIQSVEFSPDGKYVLSSSGLYEVGDFIPKCGPKDTSTRLWDAENGKQIWRLEGQIPARFSSDGKRLLTFSIIEPCTSGAGISMWDVASGQKIFDAKSEASSAKGGLPVGATGAKLAFSPDGRTFFCLHGPWAASLFDAQNGSEIGRMEGVISFNFFGDRGEFATVGPRGIEIWSSSAQRIRQIPSTGTDSGHEGAWTQDGNHLAEIVWRPKRGSDHKLDFALQIWNVDSGKIATQVLHESLDPLINPDNRRFLLWWGGGDVNGQNTPLQFSMYELESGKELWHAQTEAFKVLGFAPDGKTFLVGGPKFSVFDSDSGKSLVTLDLLNMTK
jgi:WD40 repeat protein